MHFNTFFFFLIEFSCGHCLIHLKQSLNLNAKKVKKLLMSFAMLLMMSAFVSVQAVEKGHEEDGYQCVFFFTDCGIPAYACGHTVIEIGVNMIGWNVVLCFPPNEP